MTVAEMTPDHDRRWTDPGGDGTKIMQGFSWIFWALLSGLICVGVAGLSAWATTWEHTAEIEQQAQVSAFNATFTQRVCEMYQHRDKAILARNATAMAINAKYAAQLPKGYASAMNALIVEREADIATLEKVDCGATAPISQPASLFSAAP